MKNPIIYVTRDIERALGIEPSNSYFIVANDSEYARAVREKYPDFVILIDSPIPLDTIEILEKEETANFIEDKGYRVRELEGKENENNPSPNIVVFKPTTRIEKLCIKKGWRLLNPPAILAEKIENKISQVEWLGELAGLLPAFAIAPAKEIVWQKKTLVIQFAHAHTGLGTVLINSEKELKEIQKQFPDRPVKASEFIKGPSFTCNIVVGGTETTDKNKGETIMRHEGKENGNNYNPTPPIGELQPYNPINQIIIGNPSYQITGMPPLTDSPFATVGNDWSLTHTLLNERHLDEFRNIAEKVGAKMQKSGWCGLFGIDVIYDEECDMLKLLEINARQPASTTYESQLQSRFRGYLSSKTLTKEGGKVGATIFEAHLAALLNNPVNDTASSSLTKKQIEINDGAQIVQRVTKPIKDQIFDKTRPHLAQSKIRSWTKTLNAAGYTTIPYPNTKPNSDFLRIQSDRGIMASHGTFNPRGEMIIEILEK